MLTKSQNPNPHKCTYGNLVYDLLPASLQCPRTGFMRAQDGKHHKFSHYMSISASAGMACGIVHNERGNDLLWLAD